MPKIVSLSSYTCLINKTKRMHKIYVCILCIVTTSLYCLSRNKISVLFCSIGTLKELKQEILKCITFTNLRQNNVQTGSAPKNDNGAGETAHSNNDGPEPMEAQNILQSVHLLRALA